MFGIWVAAICAVAFLLALVGIGWLLEEHLLGGGRSRNDVGTRKDDLPKAA